MLQITLLTQPVGFQHLIKKHRQNLSKIKNFVCGKTVVKTPNIDGHPSVTNSVLSGLKTLETHFNYNPKYVKNISDTVVVLSGIDTLKQAIKLKQSGIIKTLAAGPNITVLPSKFYGILTSIEIDICLVPSNWVKKLYEQDSPSLNGNIKIWAAGVDIKYWKPETIQKKTRNVLVYQKNAPSELYNKVERYLTQTNWNPIKITYGNYKKEEFKKLLNKAKFSVFLSKSESQGIALAESWATDIPTLVWNPKIDYPFDPRFKTSACPYLTAKTGAQWETFDKFKTLLNNIEALLPSFHPQDWVLRHMTDEICAKNLLNILSGNK